MNWLATRLCILVVLALGGGALAWAQGRSQFAYVDARESDGPSHELRWSGSDAAAPLLLVGDSTRLTLEMPSSVSPGTVVTVPARLLGGSQEERGTVELEVQESSSFLSGRLHGKVGAWELSGGLRIRRGAGNSLGDRVASR